MKTENTHLFKVLYLTDDQLFVNDNSIVTFAYEGENLAEFFPLGFENEDLELEFGKVNKINTLGQEDYKNIYIFGLGKNDDNFDIISFRTKISEFVKSLKEDVNIDLISTTFYDKKSLSSIITQEFIESKYKFEKISNTNVEEKGLNLYLVSDVNLEETIWENTVLSTSANFTKKLVNMPSNFLVPDSYIKIIEEVCENNPKLSLKVMNTKELIANDFSLIEAVNLGSQYDCYVACLEYFNDESTNNFKTLVGKGITYDTGGLNLKTAAGLINMKTDMAGSATALGIILGLSKLEAKANVRVLLGISENNVGSTSYKVDGVLISKSKKTIEILNTDAEGRLVLADLVTYAQEFQTDEIITLSTLTGSNANYFGKFLTPIHTTNKNLGEKISSIAANEFNEFSWVMPINQFNNLYAKTLKNSQVADLTNLGTGSDGITAACFVNEFIENKDIDFSHIDIAGSSFDKVATGVMVKSLIKYLSK